MIRIFAKQAFLDGRDRFEANTIYDVPAARGYYFIAQGWASYVDKAPLWRRLVGRR